MKIQDGRHFFTKKANSLREVKSCALGSGPIVPKKGIDIKANISSNSLGHFLGNRELIIGVMGPKTEKNLVFFSISIN